MQQTTLNITCGSDVVLDVTLTHDGSVINPALIEGLSANLISGLGKRTALTYRMGPEFIVVNVPWVDGRMAGCYSLELKGSINGLAWCAVGKIVRYTAATEAGAETVTVEGDTYDVTMEAGFYYTDSPISRVTVSVDDEYGTPSAEATYEHKVLGIDLHNLRGNGIASVEQTTISTEDNGVNVATITMDSGDEATFSVRNGSKGAKGDKGDQGDSAIWTGQGEPWSDVKNTTGTSTTAPMSQKATTDAIDGVDLLDDGGVGDLDITDDAGYVIARFEDGHVKTKGFNSETTAPLYDNDDGDFAFEDEDGNTLAKFAGGHVRTKNFNSAAIKESNLSKELLQKIEEGGDIVHFKGFGNALAAKKRYKSPTSDNVAKLNNYSQFATIVHITDLHGDAERTGRAFDCAKQLGAIVACTGDIVMYNSSDDFGYIKDIVSDHPTVQYDQALGNHDMRSLSDANGYAKYIAPLYDAQGWVLPVGVSNPLYYYRDDTTYKIRYISLCQWEDDGDSSHNFPHMKQAQVDFLISALLGVPADYGVIILQHSPENKPVMDARYTKFFTKEIGYNQSFSGVPSVQEIVDAFISKASISKTWGSVSVNANFSAVASNEFIAYLCGHYHADGISLAQGTANRQVILNETCTCAWVNMNTNGTPGTNYPKYTEYGDIARQIGTENEDAFNVYVIDRENRVIKVVRIGSDLPYDLSEKRDYMTIEY